MAVEAAVDSEPIGYSMPHNSRLQPPTTATAIALFVGKHSELSEYLMPLLPKKTAKTIPTEHPSAHNRQKELYANVVVVTVGSSFNLAQGLPILRFGSLGKV